MKDRVATIAAVALALVLVVVFGGVALRRVTTRWEAQRANAAADAEQAEPQAGPGPTDDVVVVGDSITEGGDPILRRELSPPYHLRIRGRGGYRIEEMEPYAIELATTRPEQVVINLGSNDILKSWPAANSAVALSRMLDRFDGARCVHLVTVNEYFAPGDDLTTHDRAVALNAEIRRVATSRGHDVIDWSALVGRYLAAGQPDGPITEDSVHPTERGQVELAGLYREALDRCT